jgi:hypothetical protein
MTDAPGEVQAGVSPGTAGSAGALLTTLVQGVVFVFAAFNGYLANVAPPTSRAGGLSAPESVGFASFVALFAFLLVKIWLTGAAIVARSRVWKWVASGTAITFMLVSAVYVWRLSELTFHYPNDAGMPVREVAGTVVVGARKADVDALRQSLGHDPTPEELVRKSGVPIDRIATLWEPASIRSAHDELVVWYVVMVALLALGLAISAEAIVAASSPSAAAPAAAAPSGTQPIDAASRERLASHLRSLAPDAPVAVDRDALASHLRTLAPDSPVAPTQTSSPGGSTNG